MRTITLHRGIAVARGGADRVAAIIQTDGLSGGEGRLRFQLPDIAEVRKRLDALFAKLDLTRADIFAATPFDGICACGTPLGAKYYALQHNFSAEKHDHPIVIEFTAPTDEVYVDPRDFLCTAFQLWDRESRAFQLWQSEVLRNLFGQPIRRYFAAACQSTNQSYRIAMCNLAAFDPGVLEGHMANTKVIAGRYNTRFSSAFFVKAPVLPNRICRVYTPVYEDEGTVDISLQDFLSGRGA
jgi:hypothetical protein